MNVADLRACTYVCVYGTLLFQNPLSGRRPRNRQSVPGNSFVCVNCSSPSEEVVPVRMGHHKIHIQLHTCMTSIYAYKHTHIYLYMHCAHVHVFKQTCSVYAFTLPILGSSQNYYLHTRFVRAVLCTGQ
jgi:hypothetical protein